MRIGQSGLRRQYGIGIRSLGGVDLYNQKYVF